MDKKSFIIYHNADLDGVFGGAVLWLQYPEAIMVPMQYGDSIDILQMEGHNVYMVDFSLPFEKMKELNDNSNLVRLDHHISAIKEMDGIDIGGIRDTKRSGCLIAFDYLINEGVRMPFCSVYEKLSDYDIWNKDSDYGWEDVVLPFQYGMREEVGLDIEKAVELLKGEINEQEIASKGKIVLDYQEKMNKKRCNKAGEIDFEGHNCIALFGASGANSLTFNSVYDKEKHDMMVYIRYSIPEKLYTISLYSETIDTSIISKKYGGGGHAGASGFACKKLPFNI